MVRRYGRMGGIRVPLAMQSTAQVLLAGASSFSMTYEYGAINGTPVAETERAASCGALPAEVREAAAGEQPVSPAGTRQPDVGVQGPPVGR